MTRAEDIAKIEKSIRFWQGIAWVIVGIVCVLGVLTFVW